MAIIVIVIIGSISLVGGFKKVKYEVGQKVAGNVVQETPGAQQNSLQLKTLKFKRPMPACGADDAVCHPMEQGVCCPDEQFVCKNGQCIGQRAPIQVSIGVTPGPLPTLEPCGMGPQGSMPLGSFDPFCQTVCGTDEGFGCYGKPVIYLYPEVRTMVDVSILTAGKIVVSNPDYPAGGWKNVLAEPNGALTYEGKKYRELFYETQVKNDWRPKVGIIIKSNLLEQKLGELVYQLGLEENEKKEFLDFWLPRLRALKSNYVLFSLIDTETKEANDKVFINPQPDTRIEFIAYFKPLALPIVIKPLELPTRPIRRGFTTVEWGGTIDRSETKNVLF